MSDAVRCPDCGTVTPVAARFCPGCGRPRTFLKEQIAQESLATGAAYTDLIDKVRAEELASEPLLTTLARLERRLNEVESRVRQGSPPPSAGTASAHAVPRPAPAPVVPRPLEEPALAPDAQAPARVADREPATVPEVHPGIDIESLITGRILGWVGGLAIALGAAFFLSLAFSNGWIGPAPRVIIGVVASLAMLSAGAWFFERKEALFGHVLVATSLGVMSMSLVAATRLYEFIPPQIGVLSALAVAAVAAVIAIRANSQTVAVFGLISAMIAPPLVGASASYSTLAFVVAALAGTVAVALFRRWTWLPPVAFLLSAPQAANWLTGDVSASIALAVLAGFWLLYTLAAGGEEFRRSTDRLSPTSTTVMLANAVFLVAIGFEILSGNLETWRGLFMVFAALAYGAFGGYFLYVRHERHPFGMLTAGTGVAALAIAVPVQLGGPPVPIAWAAQATALAWVYSRRRHGYSGALAIVLGALSFAHLFLVEYRIADLNDGVSSAWPYLNSSGATLGFMLAALAVTGYMLKGGFVRALLVVSASVMIALSAPFEVPSPAAVAIWTTLAGGLWLLVRLLGDSEVPFQMTARMLVAAGGAWALLYIAPPERLFVDFRTRIDHPLFWSGATVALGSLIAALAVGFWTRRLHRDGRIMAALAAAVAVYLLSVGLVDEFQSRVGATGTLEALRKQSQVALSILWATLGVLIFVTGLMRNTSIVRAFGLALLAIATVKVFIYDLASLDATYRVLSFIGLGIILLASSFAYQHFMPLFDRQLRPETSLDEPSA